MIGFKDQKMEELYPYLRKICIKELAKNKKCAKCINVFLCWEGEGEK